MSVHLITGYAGEEHIMAEDQGSFNASFFGAGQFVMEAGNQCTASIIDNNTVRVFDGDILMKGRHIRINPNTYEDCVIETGTADTNRYDLICMQYSKDLSTTIESSSLVVIRGEEVTGTPSDPSYTDGDILGGDSFNQMPLYRVKISGVVLSEIECLFEVIPTYATLAKQYEEQFKKDCQTHLDSLGILDTMEEVEANTQTNQLAGALAVKEVYEEINNNLSYASILDTISINSEYITFQNAYVENGQVLITAVLSPCVGGNYSFVINDANYAPRVAVAGSYYNSSGNDMGKVIAVYMSPNGTASIWTNSATTSNIVFSISYPLKRV